jgi:hypothetical protein
MLCSLCLLCALLADAAQVRVPNELANTEANSASTGPFSSFGGVPSYRYQQVYDASQFSALDTNGEFIIGFGFRLDTDFGESFGCLIRDMQMNFSTTHNPPDGLSTSFAQNVGSDDAMIFGRGQFQYGGGYSVGARPQPFIQMALQRPFFYRASAGNLLWDARIYTFTNSFSAASLDAANTAGDSISSLFETNMTSSIGRTSTRGLVTVFFTTPIPQLDVVRTNQKLLFRWWDQPKGFVLEGRTTMTTANWQLVPAPSVYNDGYREVTAPLDNNVPSSFYRLKYNPGP